MHHPVTENCRNVIQSTFTNSNNGSIHFGQVVGQLISIGVQSYNVDYRAGRASYYLPDDSSIELDFAKPEHPIAAQFNVASIKAAILAAQQGKVMYPEFKLLSQQAGCVGYTVWITGRHVAYFGRRGEMHVEKFPD